MKQAGGVTIYSRPHPGSHLKEFKAIGEIDAPSQQSFTKLSTTTRLTRVSCLTRRSAGCLRRKSRFDSHLSADFAEDYQRPRLHHSDRTRNRGRVETRVRVFSSHGNRRTKKDRRKRHGVFRVKLCDGSWLLEPARPHKTRATYSCFHRQRIVTFRLLWPTPSARRESVKLFAAVRKQAQSPKYQREIRVRA